MNASPTWAGSRFRNLLAENQRLRAMVKALRAARSTVARLGFTRLFGMVQGARFECPACRLILDFRGHGCRHYRAWNRACSVVKCPGCRHAWYVGLLVWTANHGERLAPPADTVPTLEQLAQMRRYTGAFWAHARYEREQGVNLSSDGACTCAPLAWREGCPVHRYLNNEDEG